MLPKTVFDVTVSYTFLGCHADTKSLDVAIKPTLVARSVPDPFIGSRGIKATELASWRGDTQVRITTYPGSHILKSIGAHSVDQTAVILNNVLTGLGKVLGVAKALKGFVAGPDDFCGAAQETKNQLREVQSKIAAAQKEVIAATTDEARKLALARLEVYQPILSALAVKNAGHTITITATVDPGITGVDVRKELPRRNPVAIDPNGLIAWMEPTVDELKAHGWIRDSVTTLDTERLKLRVNFYLDFPRTLPEESATNESQPRLPTGAPADQGHIYREATYIPIYVYAGKTIGNWAGVSAPSVGQSSRLVRENKDNELLIEPQRMVFAQYGQIMQLQLQARFLQDLEWSISFLENGEITDMNFTSKAAGVAATNALNTALDTVRAVQDANSEVAVLTRANAALKARIDNLSLQQQLDALLAKQGGAR